MGIKLAGLLQVLGAGYAGYKTGERQNEDRERKQAIEDEDRAYLKGERDHVAGERAAAKQLKTQLIDSQKDIAPEIVTESGATYGNEEALAQDSRELNRMHAATGAPAPALEPASYTANGQTHATMAAANGALAGQNSQSARDKRAAKVMRESGDIDKARQYDEYARLAINEGTDEVLGSIAGGAPTVEAIKKAGGKMSGTIGAEAVESFNAKGGKWKIGADTTVEHYIDKDAAGREVVNSRVLGAGGKEIIGDTRTAGLMLMDAKTRLLQKNHDTGTYQAGQQITETARAHKANEDDRTLTRQQSAAQHAQSMAMQQTRMNRDDARDKRNDARGTVAGKLAEIESVLGPLSPVARKAYGEKLLGLSSGKLPPKDKEALIDKMTEEYGKTNPDPKAAAVYADTLRKSFAATENNGKIQIAVTEEMSKHEPGSPGYAATYEQAKAQLRLTDADMAGMGYNAPKGATSTKQRAIAVGVRGAPPAPAVPGAPPVRGSSAANMELGSLATPAMQARREQIEAEREDAGAIKQAMRADPELHAMQRQLDAAMGANNRVLVNNLMAKIAERKAAYGQ